MAFLTPQQIAVTGTTVVFSPVTASDTCSPDDRVILRVKNANAAACNVTLIVAGNTYGQPNPDPVIVVPATTGDVSIDLPASLADPATGLVTVTYSVTASVTSALVRA